MIDLRKFFAIMMAKLIDFVLKFTPSGATAAPGLYALKIDPQLLAKLQKQLTYSIIVSGTNGKTTTTRMIASILKASGQNFYHNRTGSNLLRGITSTLIKHINLKGLLEPRIGLWEIDEAVLPLAIKALKPKIVILTNLFRDQLDRYGEIDTLAKKWQKGLKLLPPTSTVIINADDPTVAALGKKTKAQVIYYGIRDQKIGHQSLSHASDATLCPHCLTALKYSACFVSHLGIYQCPQCGTIQPQPDIKAEKIKILTDNLQVQIQSQNFNVKLPGLYNAYNLLASFALAQVLKISLHKTKKGLQDFQPAFGRFEQIKIGDKQLKIMLVKNPTGFNQVLQSLVQLTSSQGESASGRKEQRISLLIILNDRIADGRDISWIWDVDFNYLKSIKIDRLFVAGDRRYDMTLRLKHALKHKVTIVEHLPKAIKTLINQSNKNLYILPTYTAMLEVRRILNQMKLVHSTWQD